LNTLIAQQKSKVKAADLPHIHPHQAITDQLSISQANPLLFNMLLLAQAEKISLGVLHLLAFGGKAAIIARIVTQRHSQIARYLWFSH
jgi:hypothetical protein